MSIRKRTWGEGKVAWVADYKDQNGQRRLKSFKTKKAADDWLTTAKGQVKAGTHTADSASITVGEACDLWLERSEQANLETATLVGYRSHVRYHIKPLIGAEKLSRLTRPRVETWVDQLLKDRSRVLVKKVLGSLKAIIGEAMRRGLVAQNVATLVSVKLASRHSKKVVPPSPERVKAMLKVATGRRRAILMLAACTGLRASEIRGLRWQDVDFKGALIKVRQRADTSGKIGSLKSESSQRDIHMIETLAVALKEWRGDQIFPGDALVFPGSRGGPLCHNTLAAMLGRMHELRHYYASSLINQGFNPKHVQKLMGHSSIGLTFDTYGHLFPQDSDRDRFAAVEAMLR